MARGRFLLGGIVIIAVIVIAYFALVYQPPSKDDTTGAIGTANKYRSEQITEQDVALADQAAEAGAYRLTDQEAATLFDRFTPAARVEALKRSYDFEKAYAFNAFTPAELAAAWKLMPAKDCVAMFERLRSPDAARVAATAGFTMDAYVKAPLQAKRDLLLRLPEAQCATAFAQATVQEKAAAVNLVPQAVQIKCLERMDFEKKRAFLGHVTVDEFAAALKNCPPAEKSIIYSKFTRYEKAAAQPSVTVDERRAFIARADAPMVEKFIQTMTPQECVASFEALGVTDKTPMLEKVNLSVAGFAALPMQEKYSVMKRFDLEAQRKIAIEAVGRNIPVVARFEPDWQAKFLDLASREERAGIVGRLQADMVAMPLARSVDPVAHFIGNARDVNVAPLLKNMSVQEKAIQYFGVMTPQEQVAAFEALPDVDKTPILEKCGFTLASYKAAPVVDRAAAIAAQLGVEQKAAFVDKAPAGMKEALVHRVEAAGRRALVARTDAAQRVDLALSASSFAQAGMLQNATSQIRADCFGAVTPAQQAAYLERGPAFVYSYVAKNVPVSEKANFGMQASNDMKATWFARLDPQAQRRFFERVGVRPDEQGRVNAATIGKVSQEELAAMVDLATVQEKREIFTALPDAVKQKYLAALPAEARSMAVMGVSFKDMPTVLSRVEPGKIAVAAERTWAMYERGATPQMQRGSNIGTQDRTGAPKVEGRTDKAQQ